MSSKPVTWEESESLDYITLAKAGGRKDLLYHKFVLEDGTPRVPVKPSVDWFAHPTPPRLSPDPSFKSTLSSSWMQWSHLSPSNYTLPSLPVANKSKVPHNHTRTRSEPIKLPKLTHKDPIDLSRLLSLDYQREWLENRQSKQEKALRRTKIKKAAQRKKIREHALKARKTSDIDKTDNKERFIMNRFANVPAKVKLPPI